jgi:hypothetical protein
MKSAICTSRAKRIKIYRYMGITKQAYIANTTLEKYVRQELKDIKTKEKNKVLQEKVLSNSKWYDFLKPDVGINFDSSVGIDYISFTLKSEQDQKELLGLIQVYFDVHIPIYTFDPYGRIINEPEKGSLYVVFSHNNKSFNNRLYHLAFPGIRSQSIANLLFEDSILSYCKQKLVVLKRLDYLIETASGAMKSHILSYFTEFFEYQSEQEFLNNNRRSVETTSNDKGLISYIVPKTGKYRLRFYTSESSFNQLRSELELRTGLLQKPTDLWLSNNPQGFLLELLLLFTKEIESIVKVPLTLALKTTGIKMLKEWTLSLKPINSHRAANLHIEACHLISNSNNQEFYLHLHSVYPTFLALYQKSFSYIQLSNKEKSKEFLELSFSILELLESIGWPKTRHYQRKIIECLISLEKVSLLLETKNFRTFSPLISKSVIDKKNLKIDLIINIKVFNFICDKMVPISEDFYKVSIENYLKSFNVEKRFIPDYLYVLISQTYTSLYRPVTYSGNSIKNTKSLNHLIKVVFWLFQDEYVKRDLVNPEALSTTKSEGKITFHVENSSFQINARRDRVSKKTKTVQISKDVLPIVDA